MRTENMNVKLSLAATAASALLAGTAMAADKGGPVSVPTVAAGPVATAPIASWTGCHGGGAVGYAVSNTELGIAGGPSIVDGVGAEGHAFTAIGGCDLQMGRLVVGAFGEYSWHQDHEFAIFSTPIASLDEQWAVGGRAGVLLNETTLAYGSVAYTEADLTLGALDVTHNGIQYGGGVEIQIGSGFAVDARYTYSDLEAVSYGGLEIDPDVHAVRVGLNYRLGMSR
jgi:opacity protein-like surface antigen